MKIAITFPVYINNEDHLYFTKQTIDSIQTRHDYEVFIIENYVNEQYREKLNDIYSDHRISGYTNSYGNNVSAAWNYGIRLAFGRSIDTVLVPNNDIVFHPECIDNLVEFTKNDEFVLWTALEHSSLRTLKTVKLDDSYDEHPGFSLFAVTKQGLEKLAEKERGTKEPEPGFFDPAYKKAYFEDNDIHTRILKNGLKAGKTASAKYYHFGSRTIKVDDQLNTNNYVSYETNRQYFKKKWGFDPHDNPLTNEQKKNEGYQRPFNQ